MVGRGGLEPPTSRLSGVRSNHLSYRPSKSCFLQNCDQSHQQLKANLSNPKRNEDGKVLYWWPSATTATYLSNQVPNIRYRFSICVSSDLTILRATRTKIQSDTRHFLRKEVIQPQVPLGLPCYDFTPVTDPTVVDCLLAVSASPSGRTNSHGVTGGVYKARERIHRSMLICDY